MATDPTKKDTSEYSATKAPEVRKEAEEPRAFSDERLQPGGPHGAPVDVGMSGFTEIEGWRNGEVEE
jgi:hypothetical protein